MRTIRLGPHTLRTPALWLGHDVKNPFHVWKSVSGSFGVILNAHQVLERHWFRRAASESGVHKALGFNGPVFLDSGGFQLQRQPWLNSSAEKLLELHGAIHPDVTAVLDYPLDPRASVSTNRRRWAKTLRSAEFMRRHSRGIVLAPVLHTYSPRAVAGRLTELKSIFQRPPFWCLGSLVPFFHGSYIGSRFAIQADKLSRIQRRWCLIANIMRQIRLTIGDNVLHVFGAGSLSTIFLLFLSGADSIDSAAWRLKAAYGAIQLPGLADRFLAARADHSRVRKLLTPRCREILSQCACPICGDLPLEKRVQQLHRHFEARATHNAWVLISELAALRRAEQAGKMTDFVLNRLTDMPLYRNIAQHVILPVVN